MGKHKTTWMKRLIDENYYLNRKTTALVDFLEGPMSKVISDDERDLMNIQLATMLTYEEILTIRIKKAKEKFGEFETKSKMFETVEDEKYYKIASKTYKK